MDSRESYEVMEEFVESLEDNKIKGCLLQAIEGAKPFANFRHQIDNSGEYRELWFAFRRNKNIEWIRDQLNPEFL